MIKAYRKTAIIRAEQFDGSQTSLFGYEVMPDSLLDALTGEPAYYSILIDDVESEPDDFPDDNEVSFEIGDWIVNEADEIKVMADEEFKQQYAELPVIPKEVAYVIEEDNDDSDYKLGVAFYAAYEGVLQPSVVNWILTHAEVFARAWLDGYVVVEEK
ncbi:prophage protein [Lactiplantibacillus plantarum]|nr:prophage protein [Lactiplantibacillus plantarum]